MMNGNFPLQAVFDFADFPRDQSQDTDCSGTGKSSRFTGMKGVSPIPLRASSSFYILHFSFFPSTHLRIAFRDIREDVYGLAR